MKIALIATLTGVDKARYNLNSATDRERLLEYVDTLPFPRAHEFVPSNLPHNAIALSESVYAIERLDRIVILTILED